MGFYDRLDGLLSLAEEQSRPLSALVLSQQADQLETSEESLYREMAENYRVMSAAVAEGSKPGVRSASGLTGGDGFLLQNNLLNGNALCGGLVSAALAKAVAVAEWNAAMGRIVAAPTAGSCGILPAALLSIQEARGLSEQDCVMSLFTAAAVGLVIAQNACISGAQGGCQAECGSAAAMAAAAAVELCGGTPQQIGHAVAIALKNVLGLVCDPVAGLVEIPCIMRNASGAAGALIAAELALAGVKSAIPADEAIYAMKRVGDTMPAALRETAEGGLAATETAKQLLNQVFGGGAACAACAGCSR